MITYKPKTTVIYGLLGLLLIFVQFFRVSPAVIVEDLLLAFSVPAAVLGIMASTYFYAYAAVQIPVGFFCDRLGVRFTVFCCGLLTVTGSILFAFAPNVQTASWARLLLGAGTGGVWIPILKYLSVWCKVEQFVTTSTILAGAGSIGILLATFPLAVLVEIVGWRYAFCLASLALLSVVFITFFLMGLQGKPAGISTAKETSNFNVSFLRSRDFWFLAFWAFLFLGATLSFTGLWGASYLQDTFALSREKAGKLLLFNSLGVLTGGPLWGMMSNRFFRARRPVFLISTLGSVTVWLILSVISSYPGPVYVACLYYLLGVFNMVMPLSFTCIRELFPVEVAGTAMGTLNAWAFVGVAFFQMSTGYLLDYFHWSPLAGYRAIFFLYLVGTVFAAIMILSMMETYQTQAELVQKSSSPQ